jgi:hypothetical protein
MPSAWSGRSIDRSAEVERTNSGTIKQIGAQVSEDMGLCAIATGVQRAPAENARYAAISVARTPRFVRLVGNGTEVGLKTFDPDVNARWDSRTYPARRGTRSD